MRFAISDSIFPKNSGEKLKRNLWRVFFILILLGITILSFLAKFTWDRIYSEAISKQRNAVNIVASSVRSNLNAQENLLDLIGLELVKDNNYLDLEKSHQLLKTLMYKNPSIAGFGLSDTDGNLLLTSNNLNLKDFHNLKEHTSTADSFKRTLESEHSVLGRTYFLPTINRWIMPLRKALRDNNGKTVAVMSVAMEVTGDNSFIEGQGDISEDIFLFLLRELDFFYQYASPNYLNLYPESYDIPISKAVYNKALETLQESGVSKEELLTGNNAYKVEIKDRYGAKAVIIVRHLPNQGLWVISRKNKAEIISDFNSTFILLFISFLITSLTIYFLFRRLINTEQKRLSDLEFKSFHDHLTKLPNLTKLQMLHESNGLRLGNNFTVFFLDLDNFKFVNETYGRNFGDQVLINIAERLQNYCPDHDCVVHNNGDKFIIIKPMVSADAEKLAVEQLRAILSKPYTRNGANIILTASIGIASYPAHGENLLDLIKSAEIAMFDAKKHKNHYLIFDSALYQSYQDKLKIEKQLKLSIGSDEFYMNYQPQVDKHGRILGVEALVRWNNEMLGVVPPDKFIKLAESTGLMSLLGESLISMIADDARQIDKSVKNPLDVAINISATQFMQDNFVDFILDKLRTENFQNVNFILELTESIFIEDLDYIHPKLEKLHQNGFSISLDDFGTGFSSLSLLRKGGFDELKIDKSFVDTIADDETL